MHTLVLIALAVVIGESYSGTAAVDGIGTVTLPPGKWSLEHVAHQQNYDAYVFKKDGDRIERLTFQMHNGNRVHPLGNYLDSIGDNIVTGIPRQLLPKGQQNSHDTCHIIRPVVKRSTKYLETSYIYTNEENDKEDPWISHAFVCNWKNGVLVCIHASPHVLSPRTVSDVYSELLSSSSK